MGGGSLHSSAGKGVELWVREFELGLGFPETLSALHPKLETLNPKP